MSCAIAAVSSPIFSPSPRKLSSIFSTPQPASLSSPPFSVLKHIRTPLNGGGKEVGPPKMSSALKRKRPANIDIPAMSFEFNNDMTTSKFGGPTEMEVEGEGYSVCCKRGRRGSAMEDRFAAVLDLQGDSKQAFFGIFDGHGGAGAAEFAANNLQKNVTNEISKRSEEQIEEAVKEGYLTTDSEFLREEIRGGTCCVTALIRKGDVVMSNAGDCRAVMCRGGVAEALTVDHKPSLHEERQRIENLGGYVDCSHGVWRVHGSLAVTRAIGDRHLKEWVIAEPATKVFKIRPDCEFLIMASDGLWDKVSNQEAVDLARPLCVGGGKPEVFSACKKLVDLSLTRGSTDDISVMIIQLTQFVQ
ncbi:Serine/threonine protein phosphatase [Handroanthus impetiginosus]|uniref:protein-serine/threonine phosphatase n=1 Tax=Handroanthus impetiginosus TaxID=429701 RepID=A0A2G9I146_9LAMI|nr:Serine/threonine protein phosphatase [Handroanthus impetiginosus]